MEMIKKFILSFWMPHSRKFWALLLIGFVFYEACGLYFQYVLKLNPCIECVYERACFMFFGVAALVGLIAPRFMINRILAALIWAVSSIWGVIIAIEHRGFEISYQTKDPFADTCGFFANFPAWFKLDEWLPQVFAPTGICGDASWEFLGYTMVQWIELIFVCNVVVALLFVLLSLVPQSIYVKWCSAARIPVML